MSSRSVSSHVVSHRPDLGSLRRTAAIGFFLGLALLLVAPGAASAKPKLDVAATCAGNTLTGTVTVSDVPVGTVVTVRAEAQVSAWQTVGAPATFAVVAGKSTYTVSIAAGGLTGVKEFRLLADGAGTSTTSKPIKVKDCGPPAQVPEVPAPLLIPATMLLSAVAVEGLRRRRGAVARI
jgi:hypothetical protein